MYRGGHGRHGLTIAKGVSSEHYPQRDIVYRTIKWAVEWYAKDGRRSNGFELCLEDLVLLSSPANFQEVPSLQLWVAPFIIDRLLK